MRKTRKILLYTGIGLAVILLLLMILPFAFRGKIREMIKSTVNEQLTATVNFDDDLSLSLIRSFPDIRLTLRKLSVVGKDSFQGDTLVYFPEVSVEMDLWKAIRGKGIEVHEVYLKQPLINIQYLPSGKANWDIAKPSVDTAKKAEPSAPFSVQLTKVEIEQGHLVYHDRSMGFFTELKRFDHTLSGDFGSEQFTLKTKTETPSLTLGYGGVNWLSEVKTLAEADVDMDMKNMKFSFAGNKVKLNELDLTAEGYVDMNEKDMDMDIKFKAMQNTFRHFLSLVPGAYTAGFKDVKTDGLLSFQGFLKGKMTETAMPASQVQLQISNGSFAYPGMPYQAKDIQVDFKFDNPDGTPDKSVIQLKKLAMNLGGDPFQARLLMRTPLSDPYVDGAVKGSLDLGKVAQLMPSAKEAGLAGQLKADLEAIGNYSSVGNGNLGNLKAAGEFDLRNFKYFQKDGVGQVNLDELNLALTPQQAKLNSCKGVIGVSDFDVKGKVDNLLGYALGDEVLKAQVDFKSKVFNCNSFLSEEGSAAEPKPEDTAAIGVVPIPQDIDVQFQAGIGKLVYDNFVFKDFNGKMRMHEGKLDLEEVKAGFLGGDIVLSGTYDSRNIFNPFTDMKTRVNKVSIGESFKYFALLRKFAPIAKNADGLFSASIDMSSLLNQHMQPNYASMNVEGSLSITDAAVQNVDFIKQLASRLQINWLKDLRLKAQTVKFSIKEGVFRLKDSLQIPLGEGITMKLGGLTKLDQSIAYGGWIKVPRSVFGSGNKVLEGWMSQVKQEGINVKLDEFVPVDLAILGSLTKPEVKISLKGAKNSVVNSLKEQGEQIAKDKINEQADKGLAEAQKRADQVIEEARKRAETVRREGKEAADKIRAESKSKADAARKEGERLAQAAIDEATKQVEAAKAKATNPLEKVAAEKAAKKIMDEAQRKANQFRNEANNKASGIESAGNKQADGVEAEANKRADQIEQKAKEEADQIMAEARAKAKVK